MKSPLSIKNKNGEVLLTRNSIYQDYDKDVQAALEFAAENNISLKGAELPNIVLNKAYLVGIDLEGANLSGAIINDSNLDGSSLFKADLADSQISNTSMQNTNLDVTRLNRAVLFEVDLQQSSIISSSFVGSQIRKCNLRKCEAPIGIVSFEGAFIYGSDFSDSVLNAPYLSGSSIIKSNFKDAELIQGQYQNTKFNLVDFSGAKFSFSSGHFTEFINSPLDHAEIQQCRLAHFKINGNQYGKSERLKDVAEYLAEHQPMNIATTAETQRLAMYKAIQDRDQKKIDFLILEQDQIFGQSHLFDMQGFDFIKQNLSKLNLNRIDFSGSNFLGSNLNQTSFDQSVLDGAVFKGEAGQKNHGVSMVDASARNLFLNKIMLSDALMSGMDLSYSRMNHVSGDLVDLSRSNFFSASIGKKTKLDYANFDHSNLHHVTIMDAEIHGQFNLARIHSTNIEHSDLSGSELTNCDLSNTNIHKSNLTEVNWHGTSPRNCNMKDSDLSSCKMSGSHFTHTNIVDSDLSEADLSHSLFKNSVLSNVDLLNTDMQNIVAIDTTIDKSELLQARNVNDSAKLAAGMLVEQSVCSGEEARAHLDQLKSLLRGKQEKEKRADLDMSPF